MDQELRSLSHASRMHYNALVTEAVTALPGASLSSILGLIATHLPEIIAAGTTIAAQVQALIALYKQAHP